MVRKGKIEQNKQTKAQHEEQSDGMSDDLPMFYDRGKGGTTCDKILLNNKLKVSIAMFLVAVVMPVLVYAYIFDVEETDDLSNILGTCVLHPEYRVPCLVGKQNVTISMCGDIGCCWNETTTECHHSIPTKYDYLVVSTAPADEWISLTPRTQTTPFLTPAISDLRFLLQPLTENHLQILIGTDIKVASIRNASLNINDTSFNATIFESGFSLEVRRRVVENDTKNGTLFLSTSRGPLIASDNYWELTLQLAPDSIVYGLGGLQLSTRLLNPITLYSNGNNTGTLPVVMAMDKFAQAYGIYLQNTGPLEVQFMNDANLLILRALSNEGFNIHVFAGPTPREVMSQLTDLLGRPKMPAYWALGLHICRDSNTSSIEIKTAVEEYNQFKESANASGLPYDSHCLHEKLLHDLTFNISAEEDLELVTDALASLKEDGKKFILTLPLPIAMGVSVAYTSAVEKDVLVQQSPMNASHYVGNYSDLSVAYPDWSRPEAAGWLRDQIQALQELFGGESYGIDGVVLQDNWPANQMKHGRSENLVYIPPAFNGSLSNGTLWWECVHDSNITHSAVHNLYGLQHSKHVLEALNASDALVLSTSTYPGSGHVGGSHHQSRTQVPAKWTSLKETLLSALGMGLAGIPLASGGSVCGSMADFNHTLHEALCLKWYLLSITLPFLRVSSVAPYRDPTSLTSGFTRNAVLQALKLRYTLLPYYYTTFEEAAASGMPVARPVFFEFPADALTRHLDEQFMIGSALMMAPVLVPSAINVNVYMPNETTTWYQLIGGYPINNGTGGHVVTVSTLETETTILLRGGFIVPTQKAGMTSGLSRGSPYHLLVGLNCSESAHCFAGGRLYLDQDSQSASLFFTANETSLTVEGLLAARFLCSTNDSLSTITVSTVIEEISVYGLHSIAGQRAEEVQCTYTDWALHRKNLNIDWCGTDDLDYVTINYCE